MLGLNAGPEIKFTYKSPILGSRLPGQGVASLSQGYDPERLGGSDVSLLRVHRLWAATPSIKSVEPQLLQSN